VSDEMSVSIGIAFVAIVIAYVAAYYLTRIENAIDGVSQHLFQIEKAIHGLSEKLRSEGK